MFIAKLTKKISPSSVGAKRVLTNTLNSYGALGHKHHRFYKHFIPTGFLLLDERPKRTRSQTCRLIPVGSTNSLAEVASANVGNAPITFNNSRVCEDLGRHDE
jgi:hypothetical protein